MRSKYEGRVAKALDSAGIRWEYESYRLQYWLRVPGSRCTACGGNETERSGWYTPDFWLPDLGVFLETKGRFLSKDRTKMKAVHEQHPDENIVMCFMADNKIHPSSTTRYSDWCHSIRLPFLVMAPTRSGQVPLQARDLREALSMYK
jgi:hypothetical protein